MATHPSTPEAIMELATAYWKSAALFAAHELGLFGLLAEGPLPAYEVALRLNTQLRPARMLLDACVAVGLLVRQDETADAAYGNSPEAAAFLVPERPAYLGEALRWSAEQYPLWSKLPSVVRKARPVSSSRRHLGGDVAETRRFVLAMHSRALATAHGLLPYLDFSSAQTLLDVGGGSGAYAMLLARRYPSIRVTVMDLPGITEVTEELIRAMELHEQIRVRPGDALREELGAEDFDALLFSGVLHQMPPRAVQELLRKAWRALAPGGLITVSDIMTDASGCRPAFAALFSLQMLLSSEAGGVFSADELGAWMHTAGFTSINIRRLPDPLPYTVATARRP